MLVKGKHLKSECVETESNQTCCSSAALQRHVNLSPGVTVRAGLPVTGSLALDFFLLAATVW